VGSLVVLAQVCYICCKVPHPNVIMFKVVFAFKFLIWNLAELILVY
jgi:hypothetical protein